MQINLNGKTALVTGGNSGIGRAISLALARSGAAVALTHYHSRPVTAAEIAALGCRGFDYPLDVTDPAAVTRVAQQAAADLGGRIDILVNNAGSLVERVRIPDMSDDYWRQVMDLNLSSAFYGTRAVLPWMQGGWGRIINISSVAAHVGGGPGAAAYAAAKAGLIGLTRGAAKELAGKGITVNALAPGFVPGTAFHAAFTTPEAQQATLASIPLKRAGTVEDIAGAVIYLASDLGNFITGAVIDINGGVYFT